MSAGHDAGQRRVCQPSPAQSRPLRMTVVPIRIDEQPRTAFVLAGGASLGALQAGMLQALYEHGIAPDFLVGTSAGALNAAYVATRPQTVQTAKDLAALWRGLH